ncbi:Alpha/beta hydrolase family-domain-containing protein [Schizophyllum commune]
MHDLLATGAPLLGNHVRAGMTGAGSSSPTLLRFPVLSCPTTSYPPPPNLPNPESIPPLPLLPIEPAELDASVTLPSLLPDVADYNTLPGFTYSKHLIPACKLRTVPTQYDMPRADPALLASKERRKAEMERVALEVRKVVLSDEWCQETSGYKPAVPLFNSLARFRRNGAETRTKPGLTLFFAHANGFNKETWYPTLRHLVRNHAAADNIAEIWVWEAIHHGEAAVINRPGLQGFYTWRDNTRDILNFLLHFIPAELTPGVLPTHLPRVPATETATRRSVGLQRRHVVAVGHSFSGCASALAALTPPNGHKLLHNLVLVDPVIMKPQSEHEKKGISSLTSAAVGRRARWASREEAKQSFLASPFFQRWDPAVLDAYVQGGLYEKDGGVELRMTPFDEALMFADSRTSPEVHKRLPSLTEDVEIRWIIPGPGQKEMGSSEETQVRVWLRPKNSSNVRIEGAGHLIPQEKPESLVLRRPSLCGVYRTSALALASRRVHNRNELFSVTQYRWLYNDEQQLAVRHVPFNVEALLSIAAKAAGANEIVSFKKVQDGINNRVFDLRTDNGKEYIVKIPFPVAGPKHLLTASEVATLDYIRTELNIPAPVVRSWSSHAESTPVGCEYIMYEKLRGEPLRVHECTDVDLEDDPYVQLIPFIRAIESVLSNIRFSQIGSIYYKEDVHESIRDRPLYKNPDLENENTSRFCIGPTVHREFWRAGRHALNIDRGPWDDVRDYMYALGACARASIEADPDPDNDGAYRDWIAKYEMLVPDLAPDGYIALVLWHPDLSANNIIVDRDESSYRLSGIIDWQGATVGPYYRQFALPRPYDFDPKSEPRVVYPEGGTPELAVGPDDLDEEDREEVKYTLRRAWRAYFHELVLRKEDPRLADDLCNPTSHMAILRAVTSPAHTINRGSRWLPLIRRDIANVWSLWGVTVGVDDDGTPMDPFPFAFSDEEAERAHEEADQLVRELAMCEDVLARLGLRWEDEGIVPTERFEEVKKAVEAARQAALDAAPSAEERARIEMTWPLQDGKPSLSADRCW